MRHNLFYCKAIGEILCRRGASRRGFTLTELLVVIGIIGVILGIGLPAFNAMSIDARNTSATQSMAGIINRAYVQSLGDNNMTAIRFAPAAWDTDTGDDAGRLRNRQRAIAYRYRATDVGSAAAGQFNVIKFDEFFERIEGGPELTLPEDVWVAPAESLASGTGTPTTNNPFHVLRGKTGVFSTKWDGTSPDWNWNASSNQFLDADDFVIVLDPRSGVRRARNDSNLLSNAGSDVSVSLIARDPTVTGNVNPHIGRLTRRYFGGVILYPRQAFLGQGDSDSKGVADNRVKFLERNGRPFYVGAGGSMVSGTPQR